MSYGGYYSVEYTVVTCSKCKRSYSTTEWLAAHGAPHVCVLCEDAKYEKEKKRIEKLKRSGRAKLTRAERKALGV